jgi:Flp pilus assembly protein TadG
MPFARTRLLRDHRGVVAVEFALVALPAFMLVLGIIETGILMLKESVMEGATQSAARQVRTGVVQTSGDAVGRFTTEFCNNLYTFTCSDFHFDIRTFADFPQIALPDLTFDSAGNPSNTVFQPGGAGKVVTVRVVTRHNFMTPLIGSLMGGDGSSMVLTSTAVMRTEPYDK